MKANITIVIPVRNEARNIEGCLAAAGAFDRIVVVDSGSTDITRELAEKHGATVLDFEWNGRFPKKRNWVLRNYKFDTDWVLFIDADEYLTPEFSGELSRILPTTTHAGFWVTYENYFLGTQMRHGDKMRKLCLFRVGAGEYERIEENRWSRLDMEIHEHPIIAGSIGEISAPLVHADKRDFASHIAKHNEYSSWETHRYFELRNGGAEVWERLTDRQKKKYRNLDKWWLAPAYFITAYLLRRGFLDGSAGFRFALFKFFYFWQIRVKIQERRKAEATQ